MSSLGERRDERREAPRALRRKTPWSALDEDALRATCERMRRRHARKGEVLFGRGDPFDALLVVEEGRVKVGILGSDGREQILSIATPGTTIAEAPLDEPAGRAKWLVTATALEDVVAWELPRRELDRLLGAQPAFARALLAVYARRVRSLVALVEDLALRGVPERLAAFLLAHAQRQGATEGRFSIVRSLAVETVAGRLGTVREEVQRALRLLADRGILELTRREITVLDLEALERASWGP